MVPLKDILAKRGGGFTKEPTELVTCVGTRTICDWATEREEESVTSIQLAEDNTVRYELRVDE